MHILTKSHIFKVGLVSMALLMGTMLFGSDTSNSKGIADEYFPMEVSNYWQYFSEDPSGSGYLNMEITEEVELEGYTYYKFLNCRFNNIYNAPTYLRNEGSSTYMYDSEN